MNRTRMLAVLMIVAGLASAAPIKQSKEQVRADVAALWKTANDPKDVVAATRAFFALLDHPYTVEFLDTKLVPVKCTKAEIEKWLADLNTGDEVAQRKAIVKLNYFHPSLYLTPKEIFENITTEQGHKWAYSVFNGYELIPDYYIKADKVTAKLSMRDGKPVARIEMIHQVPRGTESAVSEEEILEPKGLHLLKWLPTMRGVCILGMRKDQVAMSVLAAISNGHPDVLPTKLAKSYVDVKSTELKAVALDWESDWNSLAGIRKKTDNSASRYQPYAYGMQEAMVRLLADPQCMSQLKASLKPIQSDKAKTLKALKELQGDDVEVAKKAFDSLLQVSPRLALKTDEIVEADKGDVYMSRVYYLLQGTVTELPKHSIPGAKISFENEELLLTYKSGQNTQSFSSKLAKLEDMTTPYWTRQRLGIIMLERLGTPEAMATLEDLAKGDKRILPTRDAVDALARLKSK